MDFGHGRDALRMFLHALVVPGVTSPLISIALCTTLFNVFFIIRTEVFVWMVYFGKFTVGLFNIIICRYMYVCINYLDDIELVTVDALFMVLLTAVELLLAILL